MISAVICTYNSASTLRTTLDSLRSLRIPPGIGWELIIVDNNSTDDTPELVSAFAAAASGFEVRYIFEGNQGLSHARNRGIAAARGDIIAFTDSDVVVHADWIASLQEVFDKFDCAGAGGRIIPVLPDEKPSWLELNGPHHLRSGAVVGFDHGEQAHELHSSPYGANMAFKRAAFERHGLFRADLGKRGSDSMTGEDVEFCQRLLSAGEKIVYAPGAVVYHPIPEARLKKSYFQSYYFSYGRYLARVNGFPASAILWFGVPRYLVRSLLIQTFRWLFTFESHRRFRHKLQIYESLGEISEAHRMTATSRRVMETGCNTASLGLVPPVDEVPLRAKEP